MLELILNFIRENINRDRLIALYRGVRDRVFSMFTLLLGKSTNVNSGPTDGHIPLYEVALDKNTKVIKLILENGANVNSVNPYVSTATYIKNAKVVKLFLENSAKINLVTIRGETVLHMVARYGNAEIVKFFLKNGAKVDLADDLGETVLRRAARAGNAEIVMLLLKNGAKVDLADHLGCTALYRAVDYSNTEIVELLLTNGANDLPNTYGETALYLAVKKARIATAKIIIDFLLLKHQTNQKPDFVEKNTVLSVYWDKSLEEIKKIPNSIRITFKKLFSATPKSVVDTYNLTPKFRNNLTKILFDCKSEEFFPHFSKLLKSKLEELDPLINERIESSKSLGNRTLSSMGGKKEIPLNIYCLREIADYLPTPDIKNLLKASLLASVSKSKSSNVDQDTLTTNASCSRSSSC